MLCPDRLSDLGLDLHEASLCSAFTQQHCQSLQGQAIGKIEKNHWVLDLPCNIGHAFSELTQQFA